MPKKNKNKNSSAPRTKASAPTIDESKEETPDYFKNLGNEAFRQGRNELAVENYTRAIQLDESNHILYSNRSAAFLAMKSLQAYTNALEDAERCIELNPDWAKGYFRKGMALKALERFREAEQTLSIGNELQPEQEITQVLRQLRKLDFSREEESKEDLNMDKQKYEMVGEEQGEDKFDVFAKWLLDGGAIFPKLYLKKYSSNSRGVHASREIETEEEILSIPKPFLITVEMGKATEVGRKMQEYNVDLTASKHCYLCVYTLIDMKNPDSFYKPYYDILPKQYDNMPIFFSEDELRWLEGSYMLTQIADRKRNIKADYDEICSAAPEFENYATLEEFSWARMAVASRNFGITVDGIKTDALVPMADMLNHYRPRETKWTYEESREAFTIASLQRIHCGAQVYDSYGKKCNSRFLLNYGFAVEHNSDPDGKCHNEVRLLFNLRDEDPHLQTKIGLLNGFRRDRGMRVSMTIDDKNTSEAFSYLRFINAKNEELLLLPQIGEEFNLDENPIKPISIDTEIECLQMLSRMMEEQLRKYPTTLEEDIALLASNELAPFSNHRNCVILVRGEKEVCYFWIDMAVKAMHLLRMEWKDCKKIVNKQYNGTDDASRYINQVVSPLVRGAKSGRR